MNYYYVVMHYYYVVRENWINKQRLWKVLTRRIKDKLVAES